MVHRHDASATSVVLLKVLLLSLLARAAAGTGGLVLRTKEGTVQHAEALFNPEPHTEPAILPVSSSAVVTASYLAKETLHSAASATTSSSKLIHSNIDMGVREYSFRVVFPQEVKAHGVSFLNSELKVYLKLYCSGSAVSVAGLAGLVPLGSSNFTSSTYFYKQPADLQQHLRVFVQGATHEGSQVAAARPLRWVDPSGRDMGFWPFRGRYSLKGNVSLALDGNQQTHLLPQLTCSSSVDSSHSSRSASSSRQSRDNAVLSPGLWNVVTTPSFNQVPVNTLARLLLLHSWHHQQLGFQGTVLRCNPEEAEALILLPQIQLQLTQNRLVIWPWNLGLMTTSTQSFGTAKPYFWQVPRNQLAMLAAHGQPVKLAYFDLDEYLILPLGQSVHNASCHNLRLLDERTAAWSMFRYAARCSNCSKAELDCWEDALTLGAAASDSLEPGASLQGSTEGQILGVAQCPCLLGKPMITPGLVENTKVHKTAVARGHASRQLEPACGYLVHLQALVSNKRPWSSKPADVSKEKALLHAHWFSGENGTGTLLIIEPSRKMMNGRECLANGYSLLTPCAET